MVSLSLVDKIPYRYVYHLYVTCKFINFYIDKLVTISARIILLFVEGIEIDVDFNWGIILQQWNKQYILLNMYNIYVCMYNIYVYMYNIYVCMYECMQKLQMYTRLKFQ